MRKFIIAIFLIGASLFAMSPYDDEKVFGKKFNDDPYRLFESFLRHTKRYGWFLEKGIESLSDRAILEGSFWVEYACYYYGASYRESYELIVPLVLLGDVVDMASMVSIIVVETRFKNTIGDDGRAFGYYQIHLPTALSALEFVNSKFPDLIWSLPLKKSVLKILEDLIERPTVYKNDIEKFKNLMLSNRPVQSVIAGLVYFHKAFMAGKVRIRTDSMRKSIKLSKPVVLSPAEAAPVYWNSFNWLHYAPYFYYHYSKALTAYTRFLKDYLNVETREDYERAVLEIGKWRERITSNR